MKAKLAEMSTEEIIKNRRYPSRHKARKQWQCLECPNEIMPGDVHEFAWLPDMKAGFRLCLKCAEQFEP